MEVMSLETLNSIWLCNDYRAANVDTVNANELALKTFTAQGISIPRTDQAQSSCVLSRSTSSTLFLTYCNTVC